MLEVYSCPGVYIIGYYVHNGVTGYASFPVLEYRAAVVHNSSGYRRWCRVPEVFGGRLVEQLCHEIACRCTGKGRVERVIQGNSLADIILLNWFYGGYIVSITANNRFELLDLEIASPSIRLAVIERRDYVEPTKLEGFEWIILGYILREGDWSMLTSFCKRNNLVYDRGYCIINGWRNTSLILYRENGLEKALETIDHKEIYRINIDNNGLRHTIRIEHQ